MEINVNDKRYSLQVSDQNRKLLWILRDKLGLIGTRYGCGAGYCGACTVHINGQATRSCITPINSLPPNAKIVTVEGLTSDGKLHPIQQAFIELQVPQCGWCMSGQMMTATTLLNKSPNPSRTEIRNTMKNNYCRCGCYHRITKAIELAATLKND